MTESKRGRPCRLNPTVQRTICKALRRGATYGAAADTAKVPRQSVYTWIYRGTLEPNTPFATFAAAVKAARATA